MIKQEIGPIASTKQGIYVIKSKPAIGTPYFAKCPVCGKEVDIVATEEKPQQVKCSCNAVVAFVGKKAEKKTEEDVLETVPTEKISKRKKNMRRGIVQWGTWPFQQSYLLEEGNNFIGREDETEKSDIQLKDAYVSRQSLNIEVLLSESGYLFKLHVCKATNPVYVNGVEHGEGTFVFLNDGDTLRLGKTKLRFILEKRK